MITPRSGKVALTTAEQYVDLSGSGQLNFRVDGDDVRMAFTQLDVNDDGPYMIFDDGVMIWGNQANSFKTQVYVRADSGTATLRWMVTG